MIAATAITKAAATAAEALAVAAAGAAAEAAAAAEAPSFILAAAVLPVTTVLRIPTLAHGIGCPYVWGAEGPDSFDCSGLVTWAYRQLGIELPHQSESQMACATRVVSVSEARPGDVLWRYGHVGIAGGYGGTPYVHAPTFGAYVRNTDSLSWLNFTNALQF